ncbi:MAG: MBL fold metallo-hydrolase [Acidobacteria bacterium]|nr:MBL fold metallo-hydrolase [Acidobacteriota bacterium]
MAAIRFYNDFDFEYGVMQSISPLVRRIVARNPGSFTGPGTATYIIGHGHVAVIDPGPSLSGHIQTILHSLRGETIDQILITHTHPDHWPAAPAIQSATGASLYSFTSEVGDRSLQEGDVIEGKGWRLVAVHTPGHTSDHLCFALPEERVLFSGDHVMGWSTSVIIPPDGEMRAYMRSLEKLLDRDDTVYLPTHGPAVTDPKTHVRAFIDHRNERRTAILRRLGRGEATIRQIVQAVYTDVSAGLHGAAALSVLAHLIELVESGQVACDGPPSSAQSFRLSGKTAVSPR